MIKAFRAMGAAFALVLIGAIAHAYTVGIPPQQYGDEALINQQWLYALSGGQNQTFQSGITAHAGGGQTSAFQLPAGVALVEIDTVATAGDSVALPQCLAGMMLYLRNAGGATLDVYGNATTNPLSATSDTINGTAGSSAYTVSNNTNAIFFCAKNGAWSAGKIS